MFKQPILKPLAKAFYLLSIASVTLFSCKKTEFDKSSTNYPEGTTSAADSIKNLMYYYAKDVYLWNNYLPTYDKFKPLNYASNINGYTDLLNNLLLSAINTSTKQPFEYWASYPNETKFSYIDDTNFSGAMAFKSQEQSSVDIEGKGNDVGLNFTFISIPDYDQKYYPTIKYVSPGSPAVNSVLQRGDVILKVNGVTSGVTTNSEAASFLNRFDRLQTLTLEYKRYTTGATGTVTLNKATYNSSPVITKNVITQGGQTIGYLAYARFSGLSNSEIALNDVFREFQTQGVTSLVIDLRYNGGGYVATAEKLANLIAPNTANGKVMFVEHFNNTMQKGQAKMLARIPYLDENGNQVESNGKKLTYLDLNYSVAENTYKFDKTGSSFLSNIQKVVFIIGSNTASSSELVINSLKPYMDVKLVGEQSFGKPVGFFPIPVNKLDVYYSMFETKNSKGEGGYYAGFTPDKEVEDDYLTQLGDASEDNLAQAINYLVSGSFSAGARSLSTGLSNKVLQTNKTFNREGFKGMIETPHRVYKK